MGTILYQREYILNTLTYSTIRYRISYSYVELCSLINKKVYPHATILQHNCTHNLRDSATHSPCRHRRRRRRRRRCRRRRGGPPSPSFSASSSSSHSARPTSTFIANPSSLTNTASSGPPPPPPPPPPPCRATTTFAARSLELSWMIPAMMASSTRVAAGGARGTTSTASMVEDIATMGYTRRRRRVPVSGAAPTTGGEISDRCIPRPTTTVRRRGGRGCGRGWVVGRGAGRPSPGRRPSPPSPRLPPPTAPIQIASSRSWTPTAAARGGGGA